MKRVLISFALLSLVTFPVFAEEKGEVLVPSEKENQDLRFLKIINEEEKIDKKEEKKILREEWKDLLHGLDIFYPYFKAKEIEEWLGEKASIRIFNIKGKPKLEEDEIFYVFKIKL